MEKICEIAVWRDCLPTLFPTCCDDYEWLWHEIANEKIRVYGIASDDTWCGFIGAQIRPLSFHIAVLESAPGGMLFRSSRLLLVEWLCRVCSRWAITGDITDIRRIGRVIGRWGFRVVAESNLKSGLRQYHVRKVISWESLRHKLIQRPKQLTQLTLQLTSGYRRRTFPIS